MEKGSFPCPIPDFRVDGTQKGNLITIPLVNLFPFLVSFLIVVDLFPTSFLILEETRRGVS